MKLRSVLSLCAMLAMPAAGIAGPCPAIPSTTQVELAQYVQKKYKLPPAVRVELADVSAVGSSCYRKLLFKSAGPGRSFRVELFLSPDLRYLSRDLSDTTVDPVEEERKKHEALLAGLTGGNYPVLGPASAPVTLTVFSDFQCPYCARFASILKNDILPIEKHNVRLVFRHFPLPRHAWARAAAIATACAHRQSNDSFWAFHDFLFEHQPELAEQDFEKRLTEQAKHLRTLDSARFSACLEREETAVAVDRDTEFAHRNGVNGTPTVFVNARRVSSASPEEILTLIRQEASRPNVAQNAPGR